MFTNGTKDYPDIAEALARLDAEDPPAHVRAERLATLHVDMAHASHLAVEDARRMLGELRQHGDTQCAAVQKAQEASSTKVQRSLQDLQRGMEARLNSMEQELRVLRQTLTQREQDQARLSPLTAWVAGVLLGILGMLAVGLSLGWSVQVLEPPKLIGQPKGK